MVRKKSIFNLVIFFTIFIFIIPKNLPAKPLLVAFAQWHPWKVIETKKMDGIDARIIRSLSQKSGIEIDFYECPWPRCVEMLKEGSIDLITSFGKTPEREKFTYYLGAPYWTETLGFWVNKDSSTIIHQYEDLYGKQIGVVKGSVYFDAFDNDDKLMKSMIDQEYQIFLMLQENRIDTFIGYETVIEYQLILKGFKGKFERAPFRAPGFGSYIAISKNSKAFNLHPKLTQTLELMKKDGEIKKIIDLFLKETLQHIPQDTE